MLGKKSSSNKNIASNYKTHVTEIHDYSHKKTHNYKVIYAHEKKRKILLYLVFFISVLLFIVAQKS